MRVNIYSEEMTDRVTIISKTINGQVFTGVRFYLYLPVTNTCEDFGPKQIQGPFIHDDGDDDSSAVTFWGKADLRDLLVDLLVKTIRILDEFYKEKNKVDKGML